jgi:indole-3-glycerol phosphate synthase
MIKPKSEEKQNILDTIVAKRRESISALKVKTTIEELKSRISGEKPRGFKKALNSGREINIIAEVKQKSPSKGIIREDFDPGEFATAFEQNGAAAISVLTEPYFFGGDVKFIGDVKEKTSLPILRKDFIIDPYQVYESRAINADAILLIVAILEPAKLVELQGIAKELGMDCLVEVHNPDEVEIALNTGAELIGINNRNLKTFSTSLDTSLTLAGIIPKEKTIVSASGINSHSDIEFLMGANIHSFLVGESLMREKDIGKKLRSLLGHDRN